MQLFFSPLSLTLMAMLSGCVTPEPEIPGCRSKECVAIGSPQDIGLQPGDLIITPLEVLEDSRCPIEAECIWAGRVRVKSKLQLGHELIDVELSTEKPLRINGGMLSIAEVAPEASTQRSPIPKEAYRFGFTFAPDIMEPPKA